jgi:hypothetical protein
LDQTRESPLVVVDRATKRLNKFFRHSRNPRVLLLAQEFAFGRVARVGCL